MKKQVIKKVTRKVLEKFSNRHLNKEINAKIFFQHIPKCGGTSITSAIEHLYAKEHIIHLQPAASLQASRRVGIGLFHYREALLNYYMECKEIKYISGHFPFSNTAYESFKDDFTFLTILREPVSRFLSEYFYNRYKKSSHQSSTAEVSLEEYLSTDFGRTQGCQYVKFLVDPSLSEGESIKDDEYFSREFIEEAKQNLKKFNLIGCLEYQNLFIKQFEEYFGIQLNPQFLNKNPAPVKEVETQATDLVKRKINQLCTPDREIYEFALNNIVLRDQKNI